MYILAIDQGTSSTKSLLFDAQGKAIAKGTALLKTHYLKDGFVEQDPEGIYQNVLQSVRNCISEFEKKGGRVTDIRAGGISNQRETFVVWDRSGKPLHNAVVWQCKRSIEVCKRLKEEGFDAEIRAKTGLVIDPYFSGTKLIWLFENVPSIRAAIQAGDAYFGTVDTWLLYRLTQGKSYRTDHSNASRTLFFNLHTLDWDRALLEKWGFARLNLPEILPSAADYGVADLGFPLPITAMIGDSHAAAFGEGCYAAGTAKATMGTGCSILMNIGSAPQSSAHGMLTTICWSLPGRVDYALEGSIVSCGATIEWLKNELKLFKSSRVTERMATSVPDNNGVYLVPAFSGLGSPHWQMDRKASIIGLTFDGNKNHVVRAALESVAYQIKDVVAAMEQDAGLTLQSLHTDGGLTSNHFVMQFLADLLGISVKNIGIGDVSALGAAYLAGLQAGIYRDLNHLQSFHEQGRNKTYEPSADRTWIEGQYDGWKKAIR